jgi:hypothetical protein
MDEEAGASGDILKTEPKSVLSGRKLEDLS